LQKLSDKSLKVIERYGNGLQFVTTFNPDLQIYCAKHPDRTFTGEAPTLATLCQTYPEKQVRVWIMVQLENFNDFVGVKEKLLPEKMNSLIEIILAEYYYFKASELLLFFYKLKTGIYGAFYGVVDPVVIMSALTEFKAYRKQQIEIYEREKQQKEREKQWEEWQKKAVPCPPHLKLAKEYVESVKNKL
jgi:hypothetical protein